MQAIFKCEVCSTHPVLVNILENESQQKYYRDQILTPKTLGMDEDFYPIKNGKVVKQICTFENVIYNILHLLHLKVLLFQQMREARMEELLS